MEVIHATRRSGKVTLRTVAEHTGLTPGTISAVLNNTRAADRIPQHTRDRVIAAARELKYQPNPLARALRTGLAAFPLPERLGIPVARGALVINGNAQFERALFAIQQAGLRIPDDVSILELCEDSIVWEQSSFASATEYPALDVANAS
ncbi:MAG TPA: LacI family DNA-binding transcriptional regulator [Terriglobales bacterium]|jgi:DNA-binding LacI/PurR family transcriptional regulator